MANENGSTSGDNWGLCNSCKWWQIEPDAAIEPQTAGMCIEEQLLSLDLRITGNGGCNRYSPGEPARAKGSAEQPPVAVPQR